MDRNFYQQKLAKEHQHEVSKELAARHLLKEARLNKSGTEKSKRIVLWFAPAILILSLLVLYFLH